MKPQRRILFLILACLAAFLTVPVIVFGAATKSNSKSTTAKSKQTTTSKAPAAKTSTKSAAAKPATKSGSSKAATSKTASSKKRQSKSGRSSSQRTPESARIQEIQQALNQRGYNCGTLGVWDSTTVDALKKFQEDQNINNLTGRGKLDSLTLIALGLGPQRETPQPGIAAPQPPGQPEGKNE